jgi:hypothetical protein
MEIIWTMYDVKLVELSRPNREYLENKINELETSSKTKNIRDLFRSTNEFKSYRPRTNMVKEENGDLLADSHSILNRWKNYFCQLLNVQGVGDVMQTEIIQLSQ